MLQSSDHLINVFLKENINWVHYCKLEKYEYMDDQYIFFQSWMQEFTAEMILAYIINVRLSSDEEIYYILGSWNSHVTENQQSLLLLGGFTGVPQG